MPRYLIAQAADTGWHIDAAKLTGLLTAQWPILRLTVEPRDKIMLEWCMMIDEEDIDIRLHRPGNFFGLDGNLDRAAVFAAWIRSLVPPDEDLLLMDQGANTVVRVRAGMTAQDVLARWAEDPPDDGGWDIEE